MITRRRFVTMSAGFAVAPLVAYLPIAVVAGVLFLVAWNLIDFQRIRKILATSRGEGAVLAVTFFSTLLLDLEFAILVGVIVSLVLYLNRTSHPILRSLVPAARRPPGPAGLHLDQVVPGSQWDVVQLESRVLFQGDGLHGQVAIGVRESNWQGG